MNIPPKYEDVVARLDAALGREATLIANANQHKLAMDAACGEIELLQQRLTVAEHDAALGAANLKLSEGVIDIAIEHACELQERAATAEQRVAELEQLLADVPQIHLEGCDFHGFNADGSEPLEFTDDPVKKIKSIRLIGWRCDGPRMAEEGEGS